MSDAPTTFPMWAIWIAAVLAVVVPILAIVTATHTADAARARAAARSHEGVKKRLGTIFFTFVRAAVFDRAPDDGHGRATYHVWAFGTRGPATVLVGFEHDDDTAAWTQRTIALREWIPFARPRPLES